MVDNKQNQNQGVRANPKDEIYTDYRQITKIQPKKEKE